ncbi:hypothetical protein BC343_26035 [Mucilaginibacter pedocola]|uniref:Uncharacterized protein n=2 Tax=Mucilaginibacter pedocola TaxID=1792845 RepID=A0A1S9PGZ2_9SPHI|nr:hypothetical protein BC343_26035 [Mucilaginibacter pedocola]
MAMSAIVACNNKKPMLTQAPQNPAETPTSQQTWNYGQLTDTIRNAKVIAHVKNGIYCGRGTCASVSIIEVDKKDTIRVLELSSMHSDFVQGEKVSIKPGKKPLSSISLPTIAAYDSKNYKTYYGTILAAN